MSHVVKNKSLPSTGKGENPNATVSDVTVASKEIDEPAETTDKETATAIKDGPIPEISEGEETICVSHKVESDVLDTEKGIHLYHTPKETDE